MSYNIDKPINLKKMKEIVQYLAKEVWGYKKTYYFVYLMDVLIKSMRPFINIVFPKLIIDELLGLRRMPVVITIVVVMIALNFICGEIIVVTTQNLEKKYYDDIQKYLEAKIGLKIMKMNFESTENKQVLEKFQKAKESLGEGFSGGIRGIASTFSGMLSSIITLIGTIGIVLIHSKILILLVLVNVVINNFVNSKKNAVQFLNFKILSSISRSFNYFQVVLADIRYGKDVRLYNASDMMMTEIDGFYDKQINILKEQSTKISKYLGISSICSALTSGLCYFYMGYLALNRAIGIGDFSMLATASTTFIDAINSILKHLLDLQKKCVYADEYVSFMTLVQYNPTLGNKNLSGTNKFEIELKNVSFRYPDTNVDVLKNISLTIQNGQRLSIVGHNGSGKTTLIKLLCRLYSVSEGEILLNGINILDYDYDEYIKKITVVFQDFKILPLTIKENIALENADNASDKEIISLLKRVGLKQKLDDLKEGLYSHVFKSYDLTGFEPSGGEQQKMAIARALYKNSPIVILDEPTAALDPIGEYEIYSQFNDLIGDKMAIYISHRLSSCKFCDKIAVLNEGKLCEYGTHDELIACNGIYANMYKVQAQYYI